MRDTDRYHVYLNGDELSRVGSAKIRTNNRPKVEWMEHTNLFK